MKQMIAEITAHRPLAKDVFIMTLGGDMSAVTAPGQFVNIALPGFYLRRPLSVCDWGAQTLTLIYKAVGRGTEAMRSLAVSDTLDVLTGLGNGYDLSKSGDRPLLIGGGVGVPPLYGLCRCLRAEGKSPRVILGFGSADEVFYEREFAALGADVTVMTADGTHGRQGFVTAAMDDEPYTYFYACGPMPMFRAVNEAARTSGQFSFEERMGCGFGACMGCSLETASGAKRVCKDGPVFEREAILWKQV